MTQILVAVNGRQKNKKKQKLQKIVKKSVAITQIFVANGK